MDVISQLQGIDAAGLLRLGAPRDGHVLVHVVPKRGGFVGADGVVEAEFDGGVALAGGYAAIDVVARAEHGDDGAVDGGEAHGVTQLDGV